jgi:acetyl esterase/lipase
MVGWGALLAGAVLAVPACAGVVRPRWKALRMVWDGIATVGNELVWPLLPIAAGATAIFGVLGAARTPTGVTGLALLAAAGVMMCVSWRRARADGAALERALIDALGPEYRRQVLAGRMGWLRQAIRFRDWARPLRFDATGIDIRADLAYGEHGRFNTLDVLGPSVPSSSPAPVLMHLHGGGLVLGEKSVEALPLLHHVARRGWIVVSVNYRLSPAVRWPAHVEDAKRALAWIREHIHEYGGDPSFVAVTGGSAGGMLAALLALTPNDPRLQPGFKGADTAVQAAVPFYGSYEYPEEDELEYFGRLVMPRTRTEDPALWRDAFPMSHLRPDAPPFFVLHGSHDALAPVSDARVFTKRLREVSRSPVAYAEQHGASHGYDAVASLRTLLVVDAVHRFLECAYADHVRSRQARAATGEAAAYDAARV